MDRQKTYETVRDALLKQGQRSIVQERCVYRGPNGLKCAAGHLIPDELYSPSFESTGIRSVLNRSSKLKDYLGVVTSDDYYFLEYLQELHDCVPPKDWKDTLVAFAIINNLNP